LVDLLEGQPTLHFHRLMIQRFVLFPNGSWKVSEAVWWDPKVGWTTLGSSDLAPPHIYICRPSFVSALIYGPNKLGWSFDRIGLHLVQLGGPMDPCDIHLAFTSSLDANRHSTNIWDDSWVCFLARHGKVDSSCAFVGSPDLAFWPLVLTPLPLGFMMSREALDQVWEPLGFGPGRLGSLDPLCPLPT